MSRYELVAIKNPSRKLVMGHLVSVPRFFLDCYDLENPADPYESEVPNISELFKHDDTTAALNKLLQQGEMFLGENINYEVAAAMREDMRKHIGQKPYCRDAQEIIRRVLEQEKQIVFAMPD